MGNISDIGLQLKIRIYSWTTEKTIKSLFLNYPNQIYKRLQYVGA